MKGSQVRIEVLILAAVVASCGPCCSIAAAVDEVEAVPVSVMTRNLYLGADLSGVIGALIYDPGSVPAAAGQVWADVQSTDFNVRAEALADEIEAAAPDLVGLQEVALWRTQIPADSLSAHPRKARIVEYDFLKILLRALRDRDLRYRAVAVQTGTDVELPGITEDGLVDIRFTDRDVILARNGVAATRHRRGNFETALVFPVGEGLRSERSWVSVDARVGDRRFRFISTHLEDGVEEVQRAQLAEIMAGPAATDLPVVMVGDFNSDEDNGGYSPGVHADAVAAGLTDSWTAVHPGDPGLTWGHAPSLTDAGDSFTLRLDYVFHGSGVTTTEAAIVGIDPALMVGGLWPSDHGGLAVTLMID
jgi:endonuclease/exonuclease/phosphatase family metal-dependent hydrolase